MIEECKIVIGLNKLHYIHYEYHGHDSFIWINRDDFERAGIKWCCIERKAVYGQFIGRVRFYISIDERGVRAKYEVFDTCVYGGNKDAYSSK